MSELAVLFNYYIGELKRDWKNIPNRISLTRLFLGAVPAILMATGIENYRLFAFYLFAVLVFSDCLDGFFARILNQKTAIGLIIDPIADRVIMGSMLILMMFQGFQARLWLFYILTWLAVSAVIISMILLRALIGHRSIEVNFAGKTKTVFLSGLLICLVGEYVYRLDLLSIAIPYLASITLAMSLFSFFEYILKYLMPGGDRYESRYGAKNPAEDVVWLFLVIFIVLYLLVNFTSIDIELSSNLPYISVFWVSLLAIYITESIIGLHNFQKRL